MGTRIVAVCTTLLISIAAMLVADEAQAGSDEWTSNGPYGGSVGALAIDPTAPSTLYAGTRAGVFRSTDSGASWSPAGSGLPANADVRHLAIVPQMPTTLYASAGDLGLYKSVDGANSWTSLAENLSVSSVGPVVIDPLTPSTLYAAALERIYKSTDGGSSWTETSSGIPTDVFLIRCLAIDPQTPSTLYAGTFAGLYRSVDGGGQWQLIGIPTLPRFITSVAIDPQNSQTLYVSGDDDFATDESRVFKSTDGGETWSARVVEAISSTVITLAINPQTPSTLYATVPVNFERTRYGYYRSVDGGDQWVLWHIGPPNGALAIDPQSPNVLYANTGEGVLRSTDSADNWTARNQGLANTSIDDLAAVPRFQDMLYAAGPRGVFRSMDGGDSWTALEGDHPPIAFVQDLVVDPSDPSTLYMATQAAFTDILLDVVLRSTDGGERWSLLENGLPFNIPMDSLVIDPLTPQTLYLATGIFGIFKTSDGGDLWQPSSEGLNGAHVAALAVDPVDPATLYAGGFDNLFKSTDAGTSWQDISAGLPPTPNGPGITMLRVDARTPTTVYAHGEFGLVRSLDGGASWVTLDNGLSGNIEDLAVDPERSTTLYAGGSAGVFQSTDGGSSWSLLNDGLVVTNVSSLWIHPDTPATIYAGTRGGGVVSRQNSERLETSFLRGGRFNVRVDWRDFEGATGAGRVAAVRESGASGVQLKSSDSVVSQFFSPDNWELLAKVLDGRAINGHFWVFLSAATNVELTTTVTDTHCGVTRTYVNPLGEAAPAVTDTTAFPDCAEPAPPACVESESVVCLGEGRFRVETGWRDFVGASGTGETVTIPDVGLAESEDSSLFYFFSDDNWELLIKVLDGCAINDRFWVFAAATTNVEYTITVTDTLTEQTMLYTNPLGRAAEAITDTEAFATCSAP